MEPGTTMAPMPLLEVVKERGRCFAVVATGGSAFYFLKGGAQAVRTNAPRIGRWGVWLGVEAAIGSALEHVNKKDDRFNTMISFGTASAVVSMLQGPRAAALSAIKGAVFGGLTEIAMCKLEPLVADLPEK